MTQEPVTENPLAGAVGPDDRAAFFAALRAARLLPEAVIGEVEAVTRAASVRVVRDVLVAKGLLTPFQARLIESGEAARLNLGQYRLLDEIGRGGMGAVYKALHVVMERVVALKVIAPDLTRDDAALAWFRREVRALTQLQHPNVVLAYDANEVDGTLFLVMEYIEGMDLAQWVERHGLLPAPLACALMRQAALALQAAHERGLVHRDIKPANLLIPANAIRVAGPGKFPYSPDGDAPLVKVVDFGLARLQAAKLETIVGQGPTSFFGTAEFTSPEQARNVHSVDIRSDLYSLGCAFYFALTGQPPFPGEAVLKVLLRHQTETPTPIDHLRPDVPPPVVTVLNRLLAKDPAVRYQTPADLAAALAPWIQPEPATPTPPPAPGPVAAGRTSLATAVDDAAPDAPAAAAPGGDDLERVRRRWGEWTAVVARFAGRGGGRGLDLPAYQDLYRDLVDRCERLAATADEGRRDFFRGLAELVRPWVQPHSLARTDPELLIALLARCRRAERDLGVTAEGSPWNPWLLPVAAAVVLGLVVGLWDLNQPLAGWVNRWTGWPVVVKPWLVAAWRAVATNPLLALAVGLSVVLPLVLCMRPRPAA